MDVRWSVHSPNSCGVAGVAMAALSLSVVLVGCGSSKSSGGTKQSAPHTTAAGSSSVPQTGSAGAGSSATVPTGDGCQYASVAEVSAAAGATVTAKPTPPGPPFNAPGCLYASSGVPERQITVRVLTAQQIATVPGQTAQSYFNAAKTGLTNTQPISGFGDEAFTAGAVIYARKGTTVVTVTAGIGGVSAQAVAATHAVMTIGLAKV